MTKGGGRRCESTCKSPLVNTREHRNTNKCQPHTLCMSTLTSRVASCVTDTCLHRVHVMALRRNPPNTEYLTHVNKIG